MFLGISYCTIEQEKKMEEFLEKKRVYEKLILKDEKSKKYLSEKELEIGEWLQYTEAEKLEFNEDNSFLRRVIFQAIESFGDQVFIPSERSDRNSIVVLRVRSSEHLNDLKNVELDAQKKKIQQKIGLFLFIFIYFYLFLFIFIYFYFIYFIYFYLFFFIFIYFYLFLFILSTFIIIYFNLFF